MNLYYVRADTEDGDDLGLLVRADDEKEAKRHWRNYYTLHPRKNPMWVGKVPNSGQRGPIDWDKIDPT